MTTMYILSFMLASLYLDIALFLWMTIRWLITGRTGYRWIRSGKNIHRR
jgi:hypothetical protein